MHKIAVTVALFLFTILGLFGYGIYYMAEKKGLFETKEIFYLTADNADNFFEGMPIYYHGFAIGNLVGIALDDNGMVKMKLEIPEKNHRWLHSDATFTLNKPLIGSAKIQVVSSLHKPLLEPGSTVPIIIYDGIDDVIVRLKPVLQKIEHIVTNVETLTSNILDPDEPYQRILNHTDTVISRMSENKALLDTLTGEPGSGKAVHHMIEQLNSLNLKLHTTLQRVDSSITRVNEESITHLNHILIDIQSKLKRLDTVVTLLSQSPEKVVSMEKKIRQSLRKTDQILQKVDRFIHDYDEDKVVLP